MLVTSIFSFLRYVYQMFISKGCKNKELFGKVLTMRRPFVTMLWQTIKHLNLLGYK